MLRDSHFSNSFTEASQSTLDDRGLPSLVTHMLPRAPDAAATVQPGRKDLPDVLMSSIIT